MLASENRLSKKAEFDKVKAEGKFFQAEDFAALVLKRGDTALSRFGFVVSNKISSLSTQRNRIKRALNEAVRHNLASIGKGCDMVFLAKKSIAKKSTEEIMREIDLLVKKISG